MIWTIMASMEVEAVGDSGSLHISPVILGFVSDLYFASKIEVAIKAIDFRIEWYRPDKSDSSTYASQLAEHTKVPGFELLEKITRLRPVLIIFDLSDNIFPWREWLPLIKSSPATRRIPVICFGPHVDSEKLKYARSGGADVVLARSAFAEELPGVLQRTARLIDVSGIASACQESLSPLAVRGLEEFNRREYFQAHETLEEAWNHEQGVGRELYRAILQVAVVYLQIERGNFRGAMKILLRVRQWIDPLPDQCRGVNIAALRTDVDLVHNELLRRGEQGIQDFDFGLMKPVIYGL